MSKEKKDETNVPADQTNNRKSPPDQVEKVLEDYPDVFADIVNVLIYGGEERIKPEDLVDGPTASHFKAAEGNVAQKDRDILKVNARDGITYAVFGLENQTAINYVMPIRVLGYDYAAYEKMIRDIKTKNKAAKHEAPYTEEIWPDQKVLPVVTLVLYFGTKPWKGPTTLWQTADIPEELRPYVSDYKINLVQVAFLEEEIISKFQSDFRVVAEFFRAKRLGKTNSVYYNKSEQKIWDHVEELMDFFHTFTGDKRYKELKPQIIEASRKGEVTVCTLYDSIEEKGRTQGFAEGHTEGFNEGYAKKCDEEYEKGRYESLENLMQNTNMSVLSAMIALSFSEEEKARYEKWKSENKTSA